MPEHTPRDGANLPKANTENAMLREVAKAAREWRAARTTLSAEHPRTYPTNRRVTIAQQSLDKALAALDAAPKTAVSADSTEAAAERAQIVAWLMYEGDDENEADSAIVDSIALRICSEIFPKCQQGTPGQCGTCQYGAKAGLRAIVAAIDRGDHAQPEPGARESRDAG